MNTTEVKRVRVSQQQKRYLVDYMAANPDHAHGRFSSQRDRDLLESKWKALAVQLNKIGPHRHPLQWQKIWTDLKSRSKKTVLGRRQPGSGLMPHAAYLGDIEMKMSKILCGNKPLQNENIKLINTECDNIVKEEIEFVEMSCPVSTSPAPIPSFEVPITSVSTNSITSTPIPSPPPIPNSSPHRTQSWHEKVGMLTQMADQFFEYQQKLLTIQEKSLEVQASFVKVMEKLADKL